MARKEPIQIRRKWWAQPLVETVRWSASNLGIRIPMCVVVWICNRSTEYRIGNGRWQTAVTDMKVEDFK